MSSMFTSSRPTSTRSQGTSTEAPQAPISVVPSIALTDEVALSELTMLLTSLAFLAHLSSLVNRSSPSQLVTTAKTSSGVSDVSSMTKSHASLHTGVHCIPELTRRLASLTFLVHLSSLVICHIGC